MIATLKLVLDATLKTCAEIWKYWDIIESASALQI